MKDYVENEMSSLNRTMVELKFFSVTSVTILFSLLIAQWLNWNLIKHLVTRVPHTLNRTMVELKYGGYHGNGKRWFRLLIAQWLNWNHKVTDGQTVPAGALNRTMVELKCLWIRTILSKNNLLIAQWLNWNLQYTDECVQCDKIS